MNYLLPAKTVSSTDTIRLSLKTLPNALNNDYFIFVLVYDYKVVYTQKIYDAFFEFRVSDHITSFPSSDEMVIYLSPFEVSTRLTINTPPESCDMGMAPTSGDSFYTQFTINNQDCTDTDLPLKYQYFYYQDKAEFDSDFARYQVLGGQVLCNRQSADSFLSVLPNSRYPDNKIYLMGVAYDNLGSYTIDKFTVDIVQNANNANISSILDKAVDPATWQGLNAESQI